MPEIENILAKVEVMRESHTANANRISALITQSRFFEEVRKFLVDFTEESRKNIKDKLENLANSALKCIFTDKEIQFCIIPTKQKRGVQYDLYVRTDGELTPLNDAKGGGVLDVITLALRVSFLRLFQSQLRQILYLDEPFKNLDGNRLQNAISWLRLVSQEFEIAFVIVTHIKDLEEKSDRAFQFSIEDGTTQVKQLK